MKLRRLDRTGVYAVALTRLAFEDGDARRHRMATISPAWFSARGQRGDSRRSSTWRRSSAAVRPARRRCFLKAPSGTRAASLSGMEFKLRGPNATVSHKEASGLAAIVAGVELSAGRACRASDRGWRRRRLRDVFQGRTIASRSCRTKPAFSPRVAPFDVERSGFVLGEGGFGLWLQREWRNGLPARTDTRCGSRRRGRAVERLARQAWTRSRAR